MKRWEVSEDDALEEDVLVKTSLWKSSYEREKWLLDYMLMLS